MPKGFASKDSNNHESKMLGGKLHLYWTCADSYTIQSWLLSWCIRYFKTFRDDLKDMGLCGLFTTASQLPTSFYIRVLYIERFWKGVLEPNPRWSLRSPVFLEFSIVTTNNWCEIILTELNCLSFTEVKTFLSISIIWRLVCNQGPEESYVETVAVADTAFAG